MTVWAIWKSRNKDSKDVATAEAQEVLKVLITDLVRKSWNATCFMEGGRRSIDRVLNSAPSGRTRSLSI